MHPGWRVPPTIPSIQEERIERFGCPRMHAARRPGDRGGGVGVPRLLLPAMGASRVLEGWSWGEGAKSETGLADGLVEGDRFICRERIGREY